jgi:hypothetical protein
MITGTRFERGRLGIIASVCFLALFPSISPAQQSKLTQLDFATGSEHEDYLRVLQVAGIAPLHPWSIRILSPSVITRLASADTSGPWHLATSLTKARLSVVSLSVGTTINSSYPYGHNDGAVWAGRGLTLVASGSIGGTLGPVSFALAPTAFRASNAQFELADNGQSGLLAFNHASFPAAVDFPQRFGARAYSRIDAGASTIRLDSRFVTVGVSTANAWIGPATEYPFLLGTNAPGFPHLFLGTGDPVNLWLARLHARLMWGTLRQSSYSPVTGSDRFVSVAESGTVRLATSGQLLLLPRGMPGLELGVARFFHVPYREGEPGKSFWGKPFKVFFLENEFAQGDTTGADNQLVSVFFRWVFPKSGFEIFGERGYEDQFHDFRDFLQDPDHERAYMLGFQKTFRSRLTSVDVLKAEMINYQLPTIARVRVEGLVYLHSILRQGHTNRGQLLGASAGVAAAAASVIEWARYSQSGKTSAAFRRIVRDQRGDFFGTGLVNPRGSDVLIAAEIERLRFGRRADIGAKLVVMQDFNRNFEKDAANVNLQLTARLHPW